MGVSIIILDYYVSQAIRQYKTVWGVLLGQRVYRCHYNIWLWNYDDLSSDDLCEFEYALRNKRRLRLRSLSINGQPKKALPKDFLKEKKRQINQKRIADGSYKFFMILWLIIFYKFISKAIFFLSFIDSNWQIIFLLVLSAILMVYGSVFLGAISWMFIMRHYLPTSLMREFLPSLGLPKRFMSMFSNKLLR